MASLMARFYDPQSGAIRIDGVDVREASLTSLRRNIAMGVMQPPLVLSGTLRLNIAFGNPEVPEAAIVRAAAMARLEQIIAKLPNGLDETVGVVEHTLSEGEA